jgi:hypothetical protein
MAGPPTVTFATGNAKKLEEVRERGDVRATERGGMNRNASSKS